MRIQELERLVGADRATIRYYEKEGLITPIRSENGYRDYTKENAAELKKIRLLRQLGMSIQTIRELQKGNADFPEAITRQIRELSRQIEAHKRARAVCQTIHADGAAYETLDAEHYLKLMRAYMLSKWGATPGKLAMGIRLESVNGSNLAIQQA